MAEPATDDSRTIAIDLDGVLADYSGWKGPEVVGDPLPGAAEFLNALRHNGWTVIIHTIRATAVAEAWLQKHGLAYDHINDNPALRGGNPGKPIASVYLDDHAVRFTGDYWNALVAIEAKPWYRERSET